MHRDVGVVEEAEHGPQRRGAVRGGDRDPQPFPVLRQSAGQGPQGRDGLVELAGRPGPHLDQVAAGLVFELARRAHRDDQAMVEDGDAVGQPVGLLQVLGGEQHRGAVGC